MRTEHEVSEASIRRYLKHTELKLMVRRSLTSTNTVLKTMATENAPGNLALIAEEQTAGRGRLGRSFHSPVGCGLYMSLLLRPEMKAEETTGLTACAAVAVAEAIEEITGRSAGIKWVNDVLMDGKKVCGILTEAGVDSASRRMSHVIIGIGINTRTPPGGFPEEIREIAGALYGENDEAPDDLRNRLAAAVLNRLLDAAEDPMAENVFEAYRSRSIIPGKAIRILSPGQEPKEALAEALERDYALRVRYPDGNVGFLRSGEVSIRLGGAPA